MPCILSQDQKWGPKKVGYPDNCPYISVQSCRCNGQWCNTFDVFLFFSLFSSIINLALFLRSEYLREFNLETALSFLTHFYRLGVPNISPIWVFVSVFLFFFLMFKSVKEKTSIHWYGARCSLIFTMCHEIWHWDISQFIINFLAF